MNGFRQRVLAGEQLVGSLVTLNSPEVVEILCLAGFDWLFLDAEHAPLDPSGLQMLLQAAGSVPCLVRVPATDEVWIKKALDAGAAGIIVPQVNSAEQAQQVVSWCRYPPQGRRGIGLSRAHAYGFNHAGYVDTANDHVTVVVQAEHVDAVAGIEQICKVEGIDAVLIGPSDLAASLGVTGQLSHPRVLESIETVAAACRAADTRLGLFSVSPEVLLNYSMSGFSLMAVGVDVLFLGTAASEAVAAMKQPASKPQAKAKGG